MGFDVAVLVEVELSGEHSGVGDVSDAEEEAAEVEIGFDAGGAVQDANAGDFFLRGVEDFSMTVLVRNLIFGWAMARSSMMREARNARGDE